MNKLILVTSKDIVQTEVSDFFSYWYILFRSLKRLKRNINFNSYTRVSGHFWPSGNLDVDIQAYSVNFSKCIDPTRASLCPCLEGCNDNFLELQDLTPSKCPSFNKLILVTF